MVQVKRKEEWQHCEGDVPVGLFALHPNLLPTKREELLPIYKVGSE